MIHNSKLAFLGWRGALLLVGGMALAPTAAQASADGKKNTAIAVGAAAVYEILNNKTTEGLVLGAGAAYAAKQYEDARHAESQQKSRNRYYERGYGSNGNNNNGDYETYSDNSGYSNGSVYGNTPGYSSTPDFRHMNRRPTTQTYGTYGGDPTYDSRSPYSSDQSYDSGQSDNSGSQDYDTGARALVQSRKKGWRGHSQPLGQWKK